MSEIFRVRSILSSLTTVTKKPFTKLLTKTPIPDCSVHVKYPFTLLSHLKKCNKEKCYVFLGIITENILRYPVSQITLDSLLTETERICPMSNESLAKIRKSDTTIPFLDHLRITRAKLEAVTASQEMKYDSVLSYQSVEGHPDIRTVSQLFEVKMTELIEKEWTSFLLQAYSYASLDLSVTELYLVFPLQEQIVSLPLDMEKRKQWRDLLHEQTKKSDQLGRIIQQRFSIGMHISKKPSLVSTILEMNTIQPFQIFLGSPSSSKLNISEIEIKETVDVMESKRVYVHSPYLINLCKDGKRDELLVRNLQYSVALGCKGVVVHVGKSTKQEIKTAMKSMRLAITDALQFATPECPLLLETPAGQGTETLTIQDEFLRFVMSFGDPRLAICVDTCHVFTNGHDPFEYVKAAYQTGLLRLIHFNDSATTCGSCVDRHAYIGTGYIGPEKMEQLGAFGSACGIDMVVE